MNASDSDSKENHLTSQVAPTKSVSPDAVMNWLKTTQGVITSIIAVLVVLPSLINATMDIYISLFNIPRTISEQYNQELFKKHFQALPIHTGSSVIKTKDGAELAIKLSVYENGDIYVEYGNYSQWFPFKPSDRNVQLMDRLIPTALAAQSVRASPCEDAEASTSKSSDFFAPMHYYIQTDSPLTGRTFQRERLYDDGCQELITIDINSGKIVERHFKRIELSEAQKTLMEERAIHLFAPQVIDIQKIQRSLFDFSPMTVTESPSHSPELSISESDSDSEAGIQPESGSQSDTENDVKPSDSLEPNAERN
ncbi:hypothetical protein [Thioflexithrix psekupsensis]|uniref:Uncharacterized protein n=1 Tax=Thioflexithrix psekupsensis TaxID=1570016 RepID=A0A251XAP0_9GAMM|nr:hypothetical protein [Thioflexithrix psekupsensis]OUD15492.1 hypothetical protein TPSD3_02935 [Thioflexithrix psekupsensis]